MSTIFGLFFSIVDYKGGWVKTNQNLDYVIFEWFLSDFNKSSNSDLSQGPKLNFA